MKQIILVLCLLLTQITAFAQEYAIIDSRAIKLYKEGEDFLSQRRADEAVLKFKAATERSVDFLEAYLKWSQVLLTRGDFEGATQVAEKGMSRLPRVARNQDQYKADFGWLLVNIYLKSGKFEDAISEFKEIDPFISQNFKQSPYYPEIKNQLLFIEKELENTLTIDKQRLPEPLNNFRLQYFPVLTADSRKILFTKRDGLNNFDHEDIFVAYFDQGEWTVPEPISKSINTHYNEGTCTISADGNILIFTSCDAPDSFGSCDLYVAYKENNTWKRPINMGKNVNSRYWDSQPSLSADGSMLFFSSNRRGGYGGNDIWYSRRLADGQWSEAVNLGSAVNTSKDEVSPFIYFNNELLFFASDGHMGFGGMDIFYSKVENGFFSKPTNMGYPINDHRDQLALFITAQRDFAYYTENTYLNGKVDSSFMYRFPFPEEIDLGNKLVVTQGTVFDKKTGLPINATLSLVSLDNDSTLYQFNSDGKNGEFLMLYPDETFSGLYVEKKGFLPKIYNVETDGLKDQKNLEISLIPIASGELFLFENIFFDFDKHELKPESFSSLSRLKKFLSENPQVRIEIVGHTDNVGKQEYNQQLSQMRAERVQNFLVANQIDPGRIAVKGMGDKQPIFPNETPENRAKNRRIEIIIQ